MFWKRRVGKGGEGGRRGVVSFYPME